MASFSINAILGKTSQTAEETTDVAHQRQQGDECDREEAREEEATGLFHFRET